MSGGGDVKFYRGLILLGLTFAAGFVCGYQARSWRHEWLKRRRERLRTKLIDTQKQLDSMT